MAIKRKKLKEGGSTPKLFSLPPPPPPDFLFSPIQNVESIIRMK